jgi:NitT/TauT family transport system permease protein
LGASKWQIITKVFVPGVLSRVSDDIRVLTAISWTYIIVAELVNNEGGIGALIFRASRQSRLDKVFAGLFVIILIGFIQDKIFIWLDRRIFKYKYANGK